MSVVADCRGQRIARRARCISRELVRIYPKLDPETIEFAAALRKTKFDRALDKGKRLSDEEYRKVVACFRESARHAAKLLRESLGTERAEKVKRIIDEHLEHFDGSGPMGKKEDDILPEAYILNLSCAIQNMLDSYPNRSRGEQTVSIIESLALLRDRQYPAEMLSNSIAPLWKMLQEETDWGNMRLMEIGRITPSILHDIDHYLQVVLANMEFMRLGIERGDHSEFPGLLSENYAAIDALSKFRRAMLLFAKGEDEKQEVELNPIIDEALDLASRRLKHVHIERYYNPVHGIKAFRTALKHAFVNIFTNAGESIHHGHGRLQISTLECSTHAFVLIQDNGDGMSRERLGQLFSGDSTKEGGFGIGTRFCRQVIEKHGGRITYSSKEGQGTTVKISLPIGQE